MSHYKRDATSNRNALFGSASSSGGGSRARSGGSSSATRSHREVSRASNNSKNSKNDSKNDIKNVGNDLKNDLKTMAGPSAIFGGSKGHIVGMSILSGQAKIDKMSEAEEYRLKAKKAMSRGVFSRPDPLAASNYYKRAAEAYKQCGENRLERLHRIASGDCQLGQDAFATAAAEYTRAAELVEVSDEETLDRKKQECFKLYSDAASAYAQMGERARAALSTAKAAFALIMGNSIDRPIDPQALHAIESAIEAFVPDILNRKRHYRRSSSAYDTTNNSASTTDAQQQQLAQQNIITDSYAHETLLQIASQLLLLHQLDAALYAHGAATSTLESEGFATLSLSRAYLSETIITLAMGDTVAASNEFQTIHLQRNSYLSSRECALAEDLIRACQSMDIEALDDARSRNGKHRSAMANLDPILRNLLLDIKVAGRAKQKSIPTKTKKQQQHHHHQGSSSLSKPKELSEDEKLQQSLDAGFAEMEDIMGQMGLGEDDNHLDENYDDDDDDDIDLT